MGSIGKGKSKRSTNSIGEMSESAIITRFLQPGYGVYAPFGGKQRYDLVVEDSKEQFWRIQCKTARIHNNGSIIVFDTANHNYALKNKQWKPYRGECDYFAVYNGHLNKVYLIPVDQAGIPYERLRLAPVKGTLKRKILRAKDYEL